ncbi:AAA family ATPase, partial [Salmonella enterica subsp. enterica serovar Infantis]|nr:AAA family ATPase [Salmonella enterica subsp. enterica serovar Choleraesuis]
MDEYPIIDLSHLLPAAQGLARLPADERIQRLRADRWIGYPRAVEALNRLEALYAWPNKQRMPNLLLVGPTNNGKSMIVEKFRRTHPASSDADQEHIPVLVVQMPSEPSVIRFYVALLAAMGAPLRPRPRLPEMEQLALALLRKVDSAALLVDEVLPKVPLRQWVLSVPFQLRFLFASYPDLMGKALGIVYRSIATWLLRQAGFTHDTARTGAVTFIQRFGSALNLNVHFHMLFLDGVYVTRCHDGNSDDNNTSQVFRRVNAPTKGDLEAVLQQLSTRLARFLVKEGVLTQDSENSYLTLDHLADEPMQQVHGHSITYRIALGPQQGKKVFTLQTLLPKAAEDDRLTQLAKAGGFSLHAGVAVQAHERQKLEHLCRYVARPAISEQRLALTRDGRVRYELKTPYRDGTTHVIFEPLDFMAKLAALVPKPRVNLTRFHGVFAPNSHYRVTITPAKRGKGAGKVGTVHLAPEERTPLEQRAAMTWARRLKRVFNIDITECEKCQGPVKVIACIEDPVVIDKILNHLKAKEAKQVSPSTQLPP